MQVLKKFRFTIGLAFGIVFLLATITPVYAAVDCNDPKNANDASCSATAATTQSAADSVCQGVNIAAGSGSADCSTNSGAGINSLVKTIINIFSWIVGVAAVLVIIYGGFTYVIANGEPANITKARTIILYAIVGLVIVASAQLIVRFVLSQVT